MPGEIVLSLKSLFCKHEDLLSIPRSHVRKKKELDMVTLWRKQRQEEAQDLLPNQISLLREFKANERCDGCYLRDGIRCLLHICKPIHTDMCINIHAYWNMHTHIPTSKHTRTSTHPEFSFGVYRNYSEPVYGIK